MNIYLCEMENDIIDQGDYFIRAPSDYFVCVASSVDEAQNQNPFIDDFCKPFIDPPIKVDVTLIGEANKDQVVGVICVAYSRD